MFGNAPKLINEYFEERNKQWLADNMPLAFEVEEKEEVVNVQPLKRKLHDDFEGDVKGLEYKPE